MLNSELLLRASVIIPLRAMVALDIILGGCVLSSMLLTFFPPSVPLSETVLVSLVGEDSCPVERSTVEVVLLNFLARARGQYLSSSAL